MNVDFKYANGRQRTMNRRYAEVLAKLGRGTYATRDMRAAEPEPAPVDIEKLDADQLHKLAQERGVKVHHKAGADKVREALRQAS